MSILVIAEHNNKTLASGVYNTVSAAKQIGGDIRLLVMGHDCRAVAEEAAALDGVQHVFLVEHPDYAQPVAEQLVATVEQLAQGCSHVLALASSFGKNLLPRVAARLDVQQLSDIVTVHSADTFVRPIYAGNALLTVRSQDPVKVITVRSTAFERVATAEPSAVESLTGVSVPCRNRVIDQALTKSERPQLSSARIVVSGGRGIGSEENFRVLAPLADKLGAAIGASRAAVDAGFAPNDLQVGQTGKIVAPDLYLAVGISGAIQHLAGMSGSKVIVAVNKDPEAPIFEVADYGLVADLFEALPELTAKL